MLIPLLIALAVEPPAVALVGNWDDRPTATVAEGFARNLGKIEKAAKKCGFSESWVWDDDTPGAQLWVLASEVVPSRTACLQRWKMKHHRLAVRWVLPPLGTK